MEERFGQGRGKESMSDGGEEKGEKMNSLNHGPIYIPIVNVF